MWVSKCAVLEPETLTTDTSTMSTPPAEFANNFSSDSHDALLKLYGVDVAGE